MQWNIAHPHFEVKISGGRLFAWRRIFIGIVVFGYITLFCMRMSLTVGNGCLIQSNVICQ